MRKAFIWAAQSLFIFYTVEEEEGESKRRRERKKEREEIKQINMNREKKE